MPAYVTRVGALLAVVAITIAAFPTPTTAETPEASHHAPVVSFTAPHAITEGEPAVFTFTRTGDLSQRLAVNLDFFFEGQFLQPEEIGELWFEAGEAEAVLSIPTDNDRTPETDGSIGVHLQPRYYAPNATQPYLPQEPVYQQVTVLDND